MTNRSTIIIVGVGQFCSSSLGRRLAADGWDIALISRSEASLQQCGEHIRAAGGPSSKVILRTADGGHKRSLLDALDWARDELGGKIDVLCYNAARVAPNELMQLEPEILEEDFKTSAIGTLVAGQWFANNANTTKVDQGERPMLLIPSGILHQAPIPSYASLSTVKSASYNLSRNFAQVLPEQYHVQVGMPLIVEPIIPKPGGGYATKSVPDKIVEEIFMPFFNDRLNVHEGHPWISERVF